MLRALITAGKAWLAMKAVEMVVQAISSRAGKAPPAARAAKRGSGRARRA